MHKIKFTLKYFFLLFFNIFWYLQLLIPRNKNIWVFGAWYGQRFSDNPKDLYVYVLNNSNQIKPYWITKNIDVYNNLTKNGMPCVFSNSLKGVLISLCAGTVVYSSGKKDVNNFCINGSKTIFTWHGAPMKKIGLDDNYSVSLFKENILKFFYPFLSNYIFSFIVSTGEAFNKHLKSAFLLKKDQILLTGYPRNDIFYNNSKIHPLINKLNDDFDKPIKIAYLPTFRDNEPNCDLFSKYNFKNKLWNEFLRTRNMILIVGGHYKNNLINFPINSDRIIKLKKSQAHDINFFLKDIDLLITDYSGSFFDFKLTNKPIILAPFDYESYTSKSRQLYFNYSDFSEPKAYNWEEILNIIKNNKFYNNDKFDNYYNKFQDGKSCKRLYESILDKI